jgi:hypothetical protein
MELTKKDIEDFADTATLIDHKKFALIVAQILNKTQLKALQPYFSRSITFNAGVPKPAGVPLDAEDEDGEPDVPEPQQPVAPPKPAQDFGFGDVPRRGRPPMSRVEVAEREFEEVIKRKPVF